MQRLNTAQTPVKRLFYITRFNRKLLKYIKAGLT
jgi:hypothetical protein